MEPRNPILAKTLAQVYYTSKERDGYCNNTHLESWM